LTVDLTKFRNRFVPAGVFARRAFAALEALHVQEFFGRRPRGVKGLVEEVVPMAVFARNFEAPERRVSCKYLGQSGDRADGEIRVAGIYVVTQGFVERSYFIEVTTAEAPYEHLKREALARDGFVFGGPGIRRTGSRHREGSRIESKPSVRDAGAGVDDTAPLVRTAIEKKLKKDYPQPCILLVRVEPEWNLRLRDWCLLAEKAVIPNAFGKFAAVYLVHTSSALSVPAGWAPSPSAVTAAAVSPITVLPDNAGAGP
jgi:hypothetical protein